MTDVLPPQGVLPPQAVMPLPVVSLPSISIRSGVADVLASGSVTAFSGDPLEFTLGPTFKLIIVFQEEEGATASRMATAQVDKQTILITCFNFKKEVFVTGNTAPLSVGQIGGRVLYLQFRTLALVGGDITFLYTFYAGEVVGAK